MRRCNLLCVVVLVSACVLRGVAAPVEGGGEEADHAALRDLKTVFEEAVNKNQMDLLGPHLHDGFSVVTYTDREFTDFEQFKIQWQKTREKLLDSGTYTVKLLPVRSHILGDIAITKGDSENVMIKGDGEQFKFTAHWTAVCKKSDGKWKILRAHNSLDPFGNPILKSVVKKLIVKSCIAALAVGFVLGWLMRFMLGRKKASTAAS